jgi:PAS domain S-box-containing protein
MSDDSMIGEQPLKQGRTVQELRQRERELADFIETAPVGLHWVGADGTILWANQAELDLLGYTREEYIGRHIADFHADEDVTNDILARLTKNETLHDYEARLRCKDGSIRYVLISSNVRRENGEFIHTRCFTRDITESKRSEEALRDNEEQLRAVADTAPDAIFTINEKSTLLFVSQAAERIFGYTASELLGQPLTMLMPEYLRNLHRAGIKRYVETGLRHISWEAIELPGLRKDGREILLEISFSEFTSKGKRHFTGIARDITERKRAETKLSQMAAIVESSDDAIISKELDGVIVSWNPGAERLYGYTAAEAIGQPVTMLIPPDLTDEEPHIIERIKRGESVDHYDTVRLGKDGTRVDVSLTVSPVKNAAGRIVGASKIARDITKRKRAEEAQRFLAEASRELASSLEYQTTLVNVARMAVPTLADWCTVDIVEEDGSTKRLAVAHADLAKVVWANELQKRYPDDPNAQQGVANVLRTGKSELYREVPDALLVAVAQDAEHLQLMREIGFTSAIVTPLVAHGRTLGAISFVTAESGRRYGPEDLALAENLAERAALAIDNARLYLAAQQANRLKDEFLATLSHELRTPLTAVLGWSHLLRAGQLDEKSAANALETIERNARAQSQLIEDLLDVSRIIVGNLRLDVRLVDPGYFIESAIEALRPAAKAKDVRIQKVMDTGVSHVAGDPARLQQVVWNLLSNAIKFTPKGGRIQVRVERVNSHIEIAISDTGAGIKPEFLPHVFERFRQADQQTTRHHGGLGLGLAIVRHLIELHGGTVEAESPGEGQGATFIVKLPVVSVYQKKGVAERVHPTARDILPSFECPERMDGMKVLVVDDEADTRELLNIGLGQCGAEVTSVGSAQEALEAINKERPDLLVSDIGMPDEDGYELIKRVRALPARHGGKIPAIALTAYARTEDRLRALRAGYQMHVTKPVELAELVAVMASLVQRNDQSE